MVTTTDASLARLTAWRANAAVRDAWGNTAILLLLDELVLDMVDMGLAPDGIYGRILRHYSYRVNESAACGR